ncbi:hypothetical protein F1D05_13265 [Kribbella qitaiheensis]|uniref:RNA polymerase sigma-70 region 4 domain-containing protein n=1 Tax=Kribbella qitaiheensis TaxID=1544730 RepID=A0A7G6WXI6_9ACTN|nr:sigma factor-like helix-turn-helix DNA-binding protein [Kribbella qitaiheensis]QNE18701.1 hypothetical protein F1D05_13265 [Kribbella qitaiheensis]
MTNDSVDGSGAISWLDAFPWIQAAAGSEALLDGSGKPWWDDSIVESGPIRQTGLGQVSNLALERLNRWTVSQIFPGLPPGKALPQILSSTRARNAAARQGYKTTGDLFGLELGDILRWPQIGIGTVDSMLQSLASVATQLPAFLNAPQAPDDETDLIFFAGDLSGSDFSEPIIDKAQLGAPWSDAITDDLRTIATWYVAMGIPDAYLVADGLPPWAPADVIKAKERVCLLGSGDLLDPAEAELNAAALLQDRIATLDARTQFVLAHRFFADQPETLDELGQSLGVTRERVRQIEAKARAVMVGFLDSARLTDVAASVRELVSTVLPLSGLIQLVPALGSLVEAVNQPAWRVLDRLDDQYEIEDGWCAVPTIDGAVAATLTALQEVVNQHGVADLHDLPHLNAHLPDAAGRDALRSWLAYCGCTLDGDYVLTRVQTVADRAAAILSITGSPLASEEIHDRLGVERSMNSLKNALASDDRFKRVDRDSWALAEWGMESYEGVRALIRGELSRAGGRLALDALIERITGRYSVTASSVTAYASALPFEVKNGTVQIAAGNRQIKKSPEATRRLYRRAAEWLYRVHITKEHARGSGSVAPIAIATILDLQHGSTVYLPSQPGQQTVSWVGAQPTFGSIRRLLIAQDIEIDADVFMVLGDDGAFRIERIDTAAGDTLSMALALTGCPASGATDPRVDLALAIGLPEESPVASVIGGYRERGDTDIADLLIQVRTTLEVGNSPERPTHNAAVDEILDLL